MAPEVVRLRKRRPEAELEALRAAGVPLYDTKVDVWAAGCLACVPADLPRARVQTCRAAAQRVAPA